MGGGETHTDRGGKRGSHHTAVLKATDRRTREKKVSGGGSENLKEGPREANGPLREEKEGICRKI